MLRQTAQYGYRVAWMRSRLVANGEAGSSSAWQLQQGVLTRQWASCAKDEDASFIPRMLKTLRGDKKGSRGSGGASGSSSSGGSNGSSSGSSSGAAGSGGGDSSSAAASSSSALVPASHESRYRKVFAVELSRKPLFPGIYTPVVVHKNDRLVKEILDTKKNGGQAFVGAFLRRPDKAGNTRAAAAAAAASASADGADAAAAAASAAAEAGAGKQQQQQREQEDAASHLYEVGTFAQVHTVMAGDASDSVQLLLLGHRRLRREATLTADPLTVSVSHLKEAPYANDDITKATSMEIVNTMKDLLNMNPLYGEQFRTLMTLAGSIDLNDLTRLVDAAASLTSADDAALQGLLETLDVPARARMVLELLKREVELCRLQADIREQVEAKITKEQRRMILMEQLRSIKRELGLEKDDKAALVGRFVERWEPKRARAPAAVAGVVQDELDKLSGLEPVSPEFNVTRTYLDWLTALPWGEYTPEIFDTERAKQVLDEDHYGLDDVKARILEFVAVGALRGGAQGKILCLVGPPGVGKTSVGRSIARALGRRYYRFSVGGLHDVAEIKGHRRTYVGAMPGKMVQCLKATGAANPLVLIDEIDKLGRGHTGDPASALLELLDPEQNATFLDHYLDVPVDLSKVLFVCTANVLDAIPGPLADRMEVIRLSGYTSDEKRAIARSYLEPQARADAGVPPGAVAVSDSALDALVEQYCREAGVRNLKKHLEKLYRKAALALVRAGAARRGSSGDGEGGSGSSATTSSTGSSSGAEEATSSSGSTGSSSGAHDAGDDGSSSSSGSSTSTSTSSSSGDPKGGEGGKGEGEDKGKGEAEGGAGEVVYDGPPIAIAEDGLREYVGLPPFASDRIYESATPPGVVVGLAWTAMGGATLYVEAASVSKGEGKGSLVTTGQLGDVMRESATIAHTYARAFLAERDPSNRFFADTSLHVHVPAGATPKDGPSAGCTIITALLSLALGRPAAPDLAMTGEVTLTGRVLPIGGVKEKLLAARRSGVRHVVLPEGNRREYEDVPRDLKEGVTPHFVSTYAEVFELALGGGGGGGGSGDDKGAA